MIADTKAIMIRRVIRAWVLAKDDIMFFGVSKFEKMLKDIIMKRKKKDMRKFIFSSVDSYIRIIFLW